MKKTGLWRVYLCLLSQALLVGCQNTPELKLFDLLELRNGLDNREAGHVEPGSFKSFERATIRLERESGLAGRLPNDFPSFNLATILGNLHINVEIKHGELLLAEIDYTRSQLESERIKLYRRLFSELQKMAALSDHPELEPLFVKVQAALRKPARFSEGGEYRQALSRLILGLELFSNYRSRWSRYNAGATPDSIDREIQQTFQRQIESFQPERAYILIDTALNRFYLKRRDQILLETLCSTGSRRTLISSKQRWTFETPRGEFSVQRILTEPAWWKPDWAFLEEGEHLPRNRRQRIEQGALGKYALGFGGSYFIHGTPYSRLLGENVTHGCVRLSAEALEQVVEQVKVGTKIYIF